MRVLLLAVGFSVVLAGQPSWAQTPAAEPAQTPPAAEPAQAPPAPAAPPAAPAPRPFPEGAKLAYINIQMVASQSAEGQAATARVGGLNEQKVQELNQKNQEFQAAQEKLQQEITVLSAAARVDQEKQIERMQVDLQRFTEDAQAEVQALQQELQEEFQQKLMPIIAQVSASMGLHMVFSQLDSGLVWADTGLDITAEVIAEFDKATAEQTGSDGAPSPADPPPGS